MLIDVPKNFLIKNIILDEEHICKSGKLEIDDCLVDEIKSLWDIGIHTRGCCCGHNKLDGYIEVERTDIPKMINLGYEIYKGKKINYPDTYMYFDTFVPKSKCLCDKKGSETK